jgi:hypothetical protein
MRDQRRALAGGPSRPSRIRARTLAERRRAREPKPATRTERVVRGTTRTTTRPSLNLACT